VPGALTITPLGSSTSISSVAASKPSLYGRSITLSATVTSSYGTPSGAVEFMDGSTPLASVPLSSNTTDGLTGRAVKTTVRASVNDDTRLNSMIGIKVHQRAALNQVVRNHHAKIRVRSLDAPGSSGSARVRASTTANEVVANHQAKIRIRLMDTPGSSGPAPVRASTTANEVVANHQAKVGIRLMETPGSPDSVALTTSALGAGKHVLSAVYVPAVNSQNATNYAPSTSRGLKHRVDRARLTIMPHHLSVVHGHVLPPVVWTANFVNHDTTTSLTKQPRCIAHVKLDSRGRVTSRPGKYGIICSKAVDPNYRIRYESTYLTVKKSGR
jgi:hypothetical protein